MTLPGSCQYQNKTRTLKVAIFSFAVFMLSLEAINIIFKVGKKLSLCTLGGIMERTQVLGYRELPGYKIKRVLIRMSGQTLRGGCMGSSVVLSLP